MKWELEGKWAALYGVGYGSEEDFVMLDGVIWRVVCDPDDGYRSYCETIERLADDRYEDIAPQFLRRPVAVVQITDWKYTDLDKQYGQCDGFRLVDSTGHVWLTVGTDNTEDYYPSYTFDWTPKLREYEELFDDEKIKSDRTWTSTLERQMTRYESEWTEIEL